MKRFTVLLGLVLLKVFSASIVFAAPVPTQGNSTGNLNRFGSYASSALWIYSVEEDPKGRYDDCILYKLNVTTGKKTILTRGKSIYDLNIVGEYIFYLSDFPDKKFHQSFAIYKIRNDGKYKKKITKSTDEEARYMVTYDGWIYYDNWQDNQNLYKMKLDGTGKTKLADLRDVWSLRVQGDWVYFEGEDGHNGFYKVKTDGSGLTKVFETPEWPYQFNEVVSGDWIYFATYNGIEKIKTDGTQRTVLRKLDYDLWEESTNINVQGQWLYYSLDGTGTRGDYKIYKMKLDGTGETIVTTVNPDEALCDMFLVGDWIYYDSVVMYKSYQIYRLKTDGTRKQRIYCHK